MNNYLDSIDNYNRNVIIAINWKYTEAYSLAIANILAITHVVIEVNKLHKII